MIACRILGHRLGFHADGRCLVWECERGCGVGGRKDYDSPDQARRYATAFDRRATDDMGRRAPVLGLFPLRFWRWARDRDRRQRS